MCGPNSIEENENTTVVIEVTDDTGKVVDAVKAAVDGVDGVRIFQDGGYLIVHTGAKALYLNVQDINNKHDYSSKIPVAFNTLDAEYFADMYEEWVDVDGDPEPESTLLQEFPIGTHVHLLSCGGNRFATGTITGAADATNIEGEIEEVALIRLDKPAAFQGTAYVAYNITAPRHMIAKVEIDSRPF